MPIELHCNHCGKLVRAPDEAGGRHGNCPSCHQPVYIPMPSAELETLSLEPIDDAFERRKAALMKETHELTSRILREKEGLGPEKPGDRAEGSREEKVAAAARASGGAPPAGGKAAHATLTAAEASHLAENYAVAMFEGRLPQAEQYAAELRANLRIADEAIQRLVADEILPERLAAIPRGLLIGFFKQLREHK